MPNTDADKQTAGDTGTQEGDSALQNNKDQATGSDTDQKQQDSGSNKGVEREFFKLREQKRQKDSEIEELRSQLAQLKNAGQSSKSADPDDSETKVDLQSELERLKGALIQEFEGRENAKRIAAEEQNADKWLSSRQYVKEDDAFADAVAGVIHSRYSDIAKINPMVAAKQAYQDVCALKGVVDTAPDLSSARASGGAGSSAPAGPSSKPDASLYKSILNDTNWSDPVQAKAAKRRLEELKKAGQ
jgi:hypothetical protein